MDRQNQSDFFLILPGPVVCRTDIGPGPKLLYAKIADYSKINNNGFAWPSIRRLALDLGADKSSIMRWKSELIRCGLIVAVPGSGRDANRYKLTGIEDSSSVRKMRTQKESVVYARCVHSVRKMRTQDGRSVRKMRTDTDHINHNKEPDQKTPPNPPKGGMVFPLCLSTDRFAAAWDEWTTYRKETRHKLTATTVKRQLAKLEKMGHDDAIRAIEESIAQGWTGLFPPGRKKSKGTRASRKRTTAEDRGEYPEDDRPLPILKF